jgi:hypothetical protein
MDRFIHELLGWAAPTGFHDRMAPKNVEFFATRLKV